MPGLFHDGIVNNGHPKRLMIGITVFLILTIIGMVIGMSFITIDESEGQKTRNQSKLIGFFVMFGILIVTLVVLVFFQPVGLWHDIKLKLTK